MDADLTFAEDVEACPKCSSSEFWEKKIYHFRKGDNKMTVKNVSIIGIRADFDEIEVDLCWDDDADNFGIIELRQDINSGVVRVISEHTGKEFVREVLNALLNNIEVID